MHSNRRPAIRQARRLWHCCCALQPSKLRELEKSHHRICRRTRHNKTRMPRRPSNRRIHGNQQPLRQQASKLRRCRLAPPSKSRVLPRFLTTRLNRRNARVWTRPAACSRCWLPAQPLWLRAQFRAALRIQVRFARPRARRRKPSNINPRARRRVAQPLPLPVPHPRPATRNTWAAKNSQTANQFRRTMPHPPRIRTIPPSKRQPRCNRRRTYLLQARRPPRPPSLARPKIQPQLRFWTPLEHPLPIPVSAGHLTIPAIPRETMQVAIREIVLPPRRPITRMPDRHHRVPTQRRRSR